MLISIVIPTRNRCAVLKNALDALIRDPYPRKEIIVIDAASTDGTVEMLRSFGDRVLWISEKDGGEYFARNKAFAMVTGEAIYFCGDDNVVLPGGLESAAGYLAAHPETDIIFGQGDRYCEEPDGTKVLMEARRNTPGRIGARRFIRGADPNILSDTAFFRRRVVEKIGTFDTGFLGADYEFWARAACSGCRLEMTEYHTIEYIASTNSLSILGKRRLALERWKLARRYGNLADCLFVMVIYIPRQLLTDMLDRILPGRILKKVRKLLF